MNQKTIEYEPPFRPFNVAITLNNFLVGDTNDSADWDVFKIPLPNGKWKIFNITHNLIVLKKQT